MKFKVGDICMILVDNPSNAPITKGSVVRIVKDTRHHLHYDYKSQEIRVVLGITYENYDTGWFVLENDMELLSKLTDLDRIVYGLD
jgi:hypothetical protein